MHMHKDALLHLATGKAYIAMRKGFVESQLEQKQRVGKEEYPASKAKVVVRNCVMNEMSRELRFGKQHACRHRRSSGQISSGYTSILLTNSVQFSTVRMAPAR